MTEAKICGVTEVADARFAADAGAWAIGVNFWTRSSRYVGRSAPGRSRPSSTVSCPWWVSS